LEQFTGWNCTFCIESNDAVWAAFQNYDYTQVAPVTNHVWWPNGGEDPFYQYSMDDIFPRVVYYNVGSVPASCIDGTPRTGEGDPSYYEAWFDERLAVPANISIDTMGYIDPVGLNGTITARIEAVEPILATDLVVQFALWENNVNSYERYGLVSEAGIRIFHWGMWDMMPDAEGTEISLVNPGDNVDFVQTFTVEPEWNISELGVTVWVQSNSTKYVEQAHVELFDTPLTYDIDLTGVGPDSWQFVSFPINASGPPVTVINDTIWGDGGTIWDYIQWYDPLDQNDHWKTYSINKPRSLNDLPNPNNTIGFWIHITSNGGDQMLTVGAGTAPADTTINLYSGWNLVGYPTFNDTTTVADAFFGTGANRVEVFDPAEPYMIKEVAPTYTMKPGEAYWVRVPVDTIWTIDW
jgi:hypothetical protein